MRSIITFSASILLLTLLPACEGCFAVGPPDAGPGEGEGEGEPPSGIAINELMASNTRTIADATGAFPDWIELRNLDDAQKDLGGYLLTDDPAVADKMVIAAGTTIAPNGHLVIFCDGDVDQSTPTEPHAPFRLSADGEALRLADPDDTRLDDVEFPALAADESWGRLPDGNGPFDKLTGATPGLPNDADGPDAGPLVDAGCEPPFATPPAIFVNEALAQNQTGLVDPADGARAPWVELFNAGATSIPLGGLLLSDDDSLSETWALPASQSLGAGEFLVIFMDATPTDGALHASLLLTLFDEAVSVGDVCGTIFHTLPLAGGAADVSVGLVPDGDVAAAPAPLTPTPGAANQLAP